MLAVVDDCFPITKDFWIAYCTESKFLAVCFPFAISNPRFQMDARQIGAKDVLLAATIASLSTLAPK